MAYESDRIFRQGNEGFRWRVPTFLNNDRAMLLLLRLLEERWDGRGPHPSVQGMPESPSHVDSAYGSFKSPWSAGRPSLLGFDRTSFEEIADLYNSYGVGVSLAFNRYGIPESALDDEESNEALDVLGNLNRLNGGRNSVVVASDALARHVRESHPDVPVTCSVLKPIYEDGEGADYYLSIIDGGLYDEVTPRPELFLEGTDWRELPRERTVVLCNQTCLRHCPMARHHYDQYAKRESDEPYDMGFMNRCVELKSDYTNLGDRCLMGPSVMSRLGDEGFRKMKLQGRNKSPQALLDLLGSYVYEPMGWYQGVRDTIAAVDRIDGLESPSGV